MPKHNNKGGDFVKKAVVGAAVIGAGVAAVKILSDEDNRKKAGEIVNKVKEKGVEAIETIKEKGGEAMNQLASTANTAQDKLMTEFEDLKAKIEEKVDDSKTFPAARRLENQIAGIEDAFAEARDKGEELAEEVAADIQERIEALRADFESSEVAQEDA